jgi:hypothetical protein
MPALQENAKRRINNDVRQRRGSGRESAWPILSTSLVSLAEEPPHWWRAVELPGTESAGPDGFACRTAGSFLQRLLPGLQPCEATASGNSLFPFIYAFGMANAMPTNA